MSFSDILLIIISSAGLLHGALFAVYLIFFKKKTLSNLLLGLILLFMAFRIGKSVLLNFGKDLEPTFIFIGLSFLLVIGPLLRWYFKAMLHHKFSFKKALLLELVPFVLVFAAGFFINKNQLETPDKITIIFFGSILIFIYLHFATYIVSSWLILRRRSHSFREKILTKHQKSIFSWLQYVIIGFSIIWVSFVLNIIEDAVPYIVGPIMYSVVIYFLSYKAFELKTTDFNGSVFKANEDETLFSQIKNLVLKEKLYIESDVSLSKLGGLIGKNSQKTSEIINQYSNKNFNDFINYYRVEEAKRLLKREDYKNYTIATIAFDVGFSSLSSFNAAFKKFESQTPSSYRKA